jgi:catechol 2,3-dioxygenase-like lactoylglutathione lyase family enzyme
MPDITGLHHVTLPAADVVRSGDWYERVLGFVPVLMEEDEDTVTMIVLEHRCGVLLYLRRAPEPIPAVSTTGGAAVTFLVDTKDDLIAWQLRLAELGVEHCVPHNAHLGWALDMTGPDGLRIQLHTREQLSAETG